MCLFTKHLVPQGPLQTVLGDGHREPEDTLDPCWAWNSSEGRACSLVEGPREGWAGQGSRPVSEGQADGAAESGAGGSFCCGSFLFTFLPLPRAAAKDGPEVGVGEGEG